MSLAEENDRLRHLLQRAVILLDQTQDLGIEAKALARDITAEGGHVVLDQVEPPAGPDALEDADADDTDPGLRFEALITAVGSSSTVPDNPGAVDADVLLDGAKLGACTLVPDRGQLSTWGSLDQWASDDLARWIREESPDTWAAVDAIVAAVRDAPVLLASGGVAGWHCRVVLDDHRIRVERLEPESGRWRTHARGEASEGRITGLETDEPGPGAAAFLQLLEGAEERLRELDGVSDGEGVGR